MALGSSAIVKVWSWPARRFRGRFHQGFTKVLQVSCCLWSSGADPFWAAKRFRGRFHEGFTKVPSWAAKWFCLKRFCGRFTKVPPRFTEVPPRFHQGSTTVSLRLLKFRYLSGLLGPIRFGVPKGSVEGSPITSSHLSPNSFLHFSSTALALWSSAIVKVLGLNDTFVFLGSLQQMAKRFFGMFLNQFFTLVSQSPAVFWANGCCFRKGSVEGSANYSLHFSPKWLLLHKSSLEGSSNCALHLSPSPLLGSKLRELLTCLNHTNPVRRTTHHVGQLLGYSLGLFCKNFVFFEVSLASNIGW